MKRVCRDTGKAYHEYLEGLARAAGIQTPTKQDLARLDKKRANKASNKDWAHPHDADARITKMKDGRTHLAHKAEHTVDLDRQAPTPTSTNGCVYTAAPSISPW